MKTTAHFEDAIAVRRYWGLIEEVAKYLRVVLLDDCETYHTACFDRNFGKKAKR